MKFQSPTEEVAHYALALRSRAPQEWDGFLAAFDKYTFEITVAVTAAPQDQVLQAQGKAIAFRHLMKTFMECHLTPPTRPQPPSA